MSEQTISGELDIEREKHQAQAKKATAAAAGSGSSGASMKLAGSPRETAAAVSATAGSGCFTAAAVSTTAVTGSAAGATVRAGAGAFLTTFLAVVFFLEERAFLCTIVNLPFLYVSPHMGGGNGLLFTPVSAPGADTGGPPPDDGAECAGSGPDLPRCGPPGECGHSCGR